MKPFTILIVDDDNDMRLMLKNNLKEVSCKISEVENGETAIKFVSESPPDIILMDMLMPVMDGITAIRKIRENSDLAAMPIILLSSEGNKKKWVEALEAGANDFVQKPYHKSELIARICTHLKMASLTKELNIKNVQFEKERILARQVQSSLLPQQLDFYGFDIDSFYQPSHTVGGDFFDAWETKDTIYFLIGDVSGHGIAAALLMAVCKGMLRSQGQAGHTSIEVVTAVNKMLCEMTGSSGMFITLVFVSYEKKMGRCNIISAGHNPVFLIHEGKARLIESTGPVLGWNKDDTWTVLRSSFVPHETLFLYTDGVVETRNSDGEEFGEERLLAVAKKNLTPDTLISFVMKEVKEFCNGSFIDDLSMLVIKRGK